MLSNRHQHMCPEPIAECFNNAQTTLVRKWIICVCLPRQKIFLAFDSFLYWLIESMLYEALQFSVYMPPKQGGFVDFTTLNEF